MNEEGSRFAPGMMGSSVFAGATDRQVFLDIRDASGVSVADGLAAARAAFPSLSQRPLRRPVAAYIETHIEQGPILERDKVTIGVVSGIQGSARFGSTCAARRDMPARCRIAIERTRFSRAS